jgi:dTDP-4-amino-4,6-dideoxygalactose transaminase
MYLLEKLEGVNWLETAKIRPYVKHAFFWCPVRVDEEKLGMKTKDLVAALRERGVEVRHRYVAPLYKQPMLLKHGAYPRECPFSCPFYGKEIDYSRFKCPNAEKIAGKMIGLPNHPELKREELDTVISTIVSIK